MQSIPVPADERPDNSLTIVRRFDPEPPAGLPYDFDLEHPPVGAYAIGLMAYLARLYPETPVTVRELIEFFPNGDPGEIAAAFTELIDAGYAVAC